MSKDPVRPTPRPLTAQWLREQADQRFCVMADAKDALMLADAIEIAYHAARSDIECFCNADEVEGVRWYDLATATDDDRQWTEIGARYLEARGLLTRHADRPQLVRVEGAPE